MDDVAASPKFTGFYWSLWWWVTFGWANSAARIIWCLLNNLHVVPAHVVTLGLASPLYLVSSDLYWRLEEILFSYTLLFVACWSHASRFMLVESGDSLDGVLREDGEAMLFLPNHQSTADVPLLMGVMSSAGRTPRRVMWVMDRVFKFSNFGLVSWLHDDFFILAGKNNRDSSLVELKTHLKEVFVKKGRQCLVIFPEGGFLRKRRAASSRFAKKMGLASPENCTLPRTLALEVILDELGPEKRDPPINTEVGVAVMRNGCGLVGTDTKGIITKVVDVTIAYPDGQPLNVLDIISAGRPPCETHVHYRVFDASQIPSDVAAFRNWMYNLYYEKDKLLAEFYRTGRFPYKMFNPEAAPPKRLQFDNSMFVFVHLFFIALTSLYLMAGVALYRLWFQHVDQVADLEDPSPSSTF